LEISSLQENNFFGNLLYDKTTDLRQPIWLGLMKQTTGNKTAWLWNNSKELTYNNFARGEQVNNFIF
jgi:hypothetical protein